MCSIVILERLILISDLGTFIFENKCLIPNKFYSCRVWQPLDIKKELNLSVCLHKMEINAWSRDIQNTNSDFSLIFFFRIGVFMWCFVSSVFIYSIAGIIAFTMLRRHKLGKFYSVMILLMGVIIPCSLGLLSSAAIAFVYKHSSFSMFPTHAMMWGVGQTVIHAAVGFTRILATL